VNVSRHASLGLAALGLVLIVGTDDTGASTGGNRMPEFDVVQAVKALSRNDSAGMEALARRITQGSHADLGKVVGLLHSGGEEDKIKAGGVLIAAGLPAYPSLVEGLKPDDPADLVWDLDLLCSLAMQSRQELTSRLEKLFDDKRPRPFPKPPEEVEEKPAPRRICDEAYLMYRRLLNTRESEEGYLVNRRIFLKQSDEDKDREIFFARKSRRFHDFMESDGPPGH